MKHIAVMGNGAVGIGSDVISDGKDDTTYVVALHQLM